MTKAMRLLMTLHEATVKLREQPTNKKQRKRVEQAFRALDDVLNSDWKRNGVCERLLTLQLPQVLDINENLDRISSVLAGGLPEKLKHIQTWSQELAWMARAIANGPGAADALQHPADPNGAQYNRLPVHKRAHTCTRTRTRTRSIIVIQRYSRAGAIYLCP